jgi:hypothetical protein
MFVFVSFLWLSTSRRRQIVDYVIADPSQQETPGSAHSGFYSCYLSLQALVIRAAWRYPGMGCRPGSGPPVHLARPSAKLASRGGARPMPEVMPGRAYGRRRQPQVP